MQWIVGTDGSMVTYELFGKTYVNPAIWWHSESLRISFRFWWPKGQTTSIIKGYMHFVSRIHGKIILKEAPSFPEK